MRKFTYQSRINADKYLKHQVKESLEVASELFKRTTVEYEQLEDYIKELYMSGRKNHPLTIRTKEDHFERYYQKVYDICFRQKTREGRTPLWNFQGRCFDIPGLYVVAGYSNPEDRGLMEVVLPRNFIYDHDRDWYYNLLRKNGYLPEEPYDCIELESNTRGVAPTFLENMSEREALEYFYDLWPYALKFNQRDWVNAILSANYRNEHRMIGLQSVNPVSLRTKDATYISSKCIPFWIRGIYFTVTLDELLEGLHRLRKPGVLYAYGELENDESLHLYLIYTKVLNFDKDAVANFVKDADPSEIWKEEKPPKDEYINEETKSTEFKDVFVLSYYASYAGREELKVKYSRYTDAIKQGEFCSSIGTRTLWYRFRLTMSERGEADKELEEFNKSETLLVRELAEKYGVRVKGPNDKFYETFEGEAEGNLLDQEEEGVDLDFLFTEESIDIPEEEEGFLFSINQGLPSHTEEGESWIPTHSDSYQRARQVWDPGGTTRL